MSHGQLNIANENSISVVAALYHKLVKSHDFDLIHVGGNGVSQFFYVYINTYYKNSKYKVVFQLS